MRKIRLDNIVYIDYTKRKQLVKEENMKFSKQRMLDRIKSEGRMSLVGEKELALMDNLDGMECDVSCWQRVVYGEPVYWCVGKDGNGMYVNENDCI